MDATQTKEIAPGFPWITALIVSAGLVVAAMPDLSASLGYDRQAILAGELWRMFTGHWFHFSSSHLIYDLLAMAVVGWICETQKLPRFGQLCLLAPWFISAALLWWEPQMIYFGGLSAVATTALVYLAFSGLQKCGPWRWICLIALIATAGKIVFELHTGRMLFVSSGQRSLVVSSTSHIAGALTALGFFILNRPTKTHR